MVLASLLAA